LGRRASEEAGSDSPQPAPDKAPIAAEAPAALCFMNLRRVKALEFTVAISNL